MRKLSGEYYTLIYLIIHIFHKLHHLHNEFELLNVRVIAGNITLPLLGLSKLEFDFISNQINFIINSGADINLSSVYAESKVVNIDGLIELIKLSTTGDYQKPIEGFSSVSVFFNSSNCKEFDKETIIPPLQNINNLPGGYMKMIMALENTGVGHDSEFLQLIIQSCYAIKKYPRIEKN
ncbi:hypothetical protein RB653_006236 [Dictyostelium firmibasis]|uniref:Thioester reductase (TE) domain-containing protein n=1 Tax=Dictyostelium firmibasis TaxID=79012 RepID=A0AAN7U915_9MYCE